MKKFFGVVVLMLAMVITVPAFAQVDIDGPHHTLGIGSNAQAGATASASILPGAIVNAPINTVETNIHNTNLQGQIQGQQQKQGQVQGQQQGQINVNDQVIAPEQKVIFKSPTQLLAPPSQGLSELNFGNGRMKDATGELPNFAIYGIGALGREPIREVLSVNANVKFKNLYKTILSDAKDIAGNGSKTFKDIRYQVICAEAQKSWATGGNLGGAGSGVPTSGLAGGSMAGSIIPQWGGTKADDLFTIIFVKVAL